MRAIVIALMMAGSVPAMAQVIDGGPGVHSCRGGVWIPGYGWDCPVMKVLPPQNAPPNWMRRWYGPPPDWNTPRVRCYGQPWDPPACRGEFG